MLKIKRFLPLCVLNAVLFALVLSVTSYSAWAQPETSCDPELMQAMEARAWMETDREMIQNQNLMTMGDSVLEYSCFDQMVSLAGEFPADIFSDRETLWLLSTGGLPTISNISTDIALQEVVGIALFTFLFGNFGQTYLGDRTPLLGAAPPRPPRTYDCGALNYAWEKAKCMDFGEFQDIMIPGRTDFDMFYDFYWYRDTDPRDLPAYLPACTRNLGAWNRAIATSFNNSSPLRQSDRYIMPTASEALFDTVAYDVEEVLPPAVPASLANSYTAFMVESAHSLFANCVTIPTGITVSRTTGVSGPTANYADATCPNPQCYFDQATCTP